MSDLENELLGLAEDDPGHHRSKKRATAGSNTKSKAYIEESEDDNEEEIDMDLESEEGDDSPPRQAPRTRLGGMPYPLEGKYVNEDDRDYLDSLPEIERENILAARQEEIQKYKDSAQLDAMYKMAGMVEAEQDEGEEPSRKRRKHTSVTDEASRAMTELKNKRKAKDERAQRRAARRDRRARSSSQASHGENSSEEGEISKRNSWRAISPSFQHQEEEHEAREEDVDAQPADRDELARATLSRYEIVDIMYKDKFDEVIEGAFVRLMAAEPDEMGRPKYRIHRVKGIDQSKSHGRYPIEYKGRQVTDHRALICQYGKSVRLFRIADVSNSEIQDSEFSRYLLVCQVDSIRPPKRSELRQKHDDIQSIRDRAMTEDEVNRQVEDRKRNNPQAKRQKTVLQVSSLLASKSLALRRNDHQAADEISQQILDLGADPHTGQLLEGDVDVSEYDARIQRINENNKRKTREAMAMAHEAALARKKVEDAIVKAKTSAALKSQNQDESDIKPSTVKASSFRKGETPQQYVARTIDLDLGDF